MAILVRVAVSILVMVLVSLVGEMRTRTAVLEFVIFGALPAVVGWTVLLLARERTEGQP
jgi:hypothetical protein